MNPEKVLVYGFGPYGNYRHNVTTEIVKVIGHRKIATTHVFKTRFSRKMFQAVLQAHRPQLIVGLGQDSRARKIRIERKAKNWRKGLLTPGRKITHAAVGDYYVPLKLAADENSTVTYDAGSYVCNFSMFVMCEYCRNTGADFVFLHVPVNVEVALAVKFVVNAIQQWTDRHGITA